jgi:uncharacterized protein (DUF305 family)
LARRNNRCARDDTMNDQHYRHLLVMAVLSFVSMYVLMYAMVNSLQNVLQQFQPGVHGRADDGADGRHRAMCHARDVSQQETQRRDHRRQHRDAGIALFAFIRVQAQISDRQFLRSMIPHHAGAILMCEQAPIQDPEIRMLCRTIISSQQTEIDQMRAKLRALAVSQRQPPPSVR